MPPTICVHVAPVSPQQDAALRNLSNLCFPVLPGQPHHLVPTAEDRPLRRRFVIWDDAVPLAHAEVFVRDVITAVGMLPVLALAGVCTHPDHRDCGYGRLLVRAALDQIGLGGTTVALWQTGVPVFYEKLGARLVDNEFVNNLDAEDPRATSFWEQHIMVYPATTDWPSGTIDLNGRGY